MSRHASTQRSGGCTEAAAIWLGLAERVLVCGRKLRETLVRHAARQGLSEPELAVLWACQDGPSDGHSQTELAARLAVSAAQVSTVVERLRAGGLLEGRRAEHDRRRQVWRPTSAGQSAMRAAVADLAGGAARLAKRLPNDAPSILARMLDGLLPALDETAAARKAATLPSTAPHPNREDRERGAA